MSTPPPLGQSETARLEFKGAQAMEDPIKIARAVVAFLNAEGGEMWVGLGEENDVACRIEPIPDARSAYRSLYDHLVDTIEPPPYEGELDVMAVDVEGGEILRLTINQPAPGRGPFALLRKGSRQFLLRSGDRVRPMTREEIGAAFRAAPAPDVPEGPALQTLREARNQVLGNTNPTLWARLQPQVDFELELEDPELQRLVTDPEASVQVSEFSGVVDPHRQPRLRSGRLEAASGRTAIHRSGGVSFRCPLDWLADDSERLLLRPFQLLFYPISLFRLARALFRDKLDDDAVVYADLALIAVSDYGLKREIDRSPLIEPHYFREARDLTLDRHLSFRWPELESEPDLCAARLVARVYEAFGFSRKDMTRAFSWKDRRVIPSHLR